MFRRQRVEAACLRSKISSSNCGMRLFDARIPLAMIRARTQEVHVRAREVRNRWFRARLRAIEDENNLDNATLVPGVKPDRANGKEYVDRMIELMSRLYGKNTVLRVTYFSRDYQSVASIDIPIGKGTDFFYKGESFDRKTKRQTFQPLLAYDAFLGGYLKRKEIWVPGFKIRQAATRCINVTPDATVPGGLRYHDGDCDDHASLRIEDAQAASEEQQRRQLEQGQGTKPN